MRKVLSSAVNSKLNREKVKFISSLSPKIKVYSNNLQSFSFSGRCLRENCKNIIDKFQRQTTTADLKSFKWSSVSKRKSKAITISIKFYVSKEPVSENSTIFDTRFYSIRKKRRTVKIPKRRKKVNVILTNHLFGWQFLNNFFQIYWIIFSIS